MHCNHHPIQNTSHQLLSLRKKRNVHNVRQKAIVPDLSGCSEDSAISMLYDAGLSVGSIEYRSDPNSYDGAVLSQGVSAYSEVDYGTSVSLIICNNEKDESGNYICPEY